MPHPCGQSRACLPRGADRDHADHPTAARCQTSQSSGDPSIRGLRDARGGCHRGETVADAGGKWLPLRAADGSARTPQRSGYPAPRWSTRRSHRPAPRRSTRRSRADAPRPARKRWATIDCWRAHGRRPRGAGGGERPGPRGLTARRVAGHRLAQYGDGRRCPREWAGGGHRPAAWRRRRRRWRCRAALRRGEHGHQGCSRRRVASNAQPAADAKPRHGTGGIDGSPTHVAAGA